MEMTFKRLDYYSVVRCVDKRRSTLHRCGFVRIHITFEV